LQKSPPTILHIIDDMGRGGAEVMLVKLLKELKAYNNIVVTLNPKNHFSSDELDTAGIHCLYMGSFSRFPLGAIKLRRFIKKHSISLVHSHLFTATLVARLGTPKNIPLVTTIHTNVSASAEYKKWYMRLLEKWSYHFHKSTVVGVSKVVLEQYFAHFDHRPWRKHLLYTFADVTEIKPPALKKQKAAEAPFMLIAIGALRYPKNQQYLVQAFEALKNEPVELHIYGSGPQQQQLQDLINRTQVRVVLKGEVKAAARLIPEYDAFVMSSEFEGFSLSVLEAMAMQRPLLLSDIPSFREQCADTALFFDLKDTGSFVQQLRSLMAGGARQQHMADAAYNRLINNFTLQHHLQGLHTIYAEAINH
jgi:glycosyltransferase involved in cell wall biosynthesis